MARSAMMFAMVSKSMVVSSNFCFVVVQLEIILAGCCSKRVPVGVFGCSPKVKFGEMRVKMDGMRKIFIVSLQICRRWRGD